VTLPAFDERGAGGTAVVMLHGVGGGRGVWAGQLVSFAAAGYRAVAWDAPGYGDTPPIAPYDMAGLAAALGRLLDAIAAPRVVLLGHSMGGMLAQEAVIAFP
jgi:pimeloyl-ACP methyl ester carboxylesterase